ncbi:MAG: trigger factor, partial [Beijerinckiaceae bacterium]|nr:trigger factor [Beijerinckiaceae bacterium]
YRRIAERRVRLGLVLAEVGQEANVQVTDDEVTQALLERARQFPGQEKAVWDYYRNNPEALAQLRAPVFEEKVVDHIVAKANVTERVVSKDDLFKIEADDEKSAA